MHVFGALLTSSMVVLLAAGGQMRQRCPMCGQPMAGSMFGEFEIPDRLEKPDSPEWIRDLGDALGRERLSREQYRRDSREFGLRMPYMMVIPQEDDHIDWIERLFRAYDIDAEVETPAVTPTDSAAEAYRVARELEDRLIPLYEQLIGGAEDDTARTVLDNILYQTRLHRTMFEHALWMGGRR